MANNVNLKELWNRQSGAMPDTKEIFDKANQFKKGHMNKLIKTNILLLLTSIFIVWVISSFQPRIATTKIGALLTILAMVLYLVVYNRMIPLLMKADNNANVNDYLQNLLKLKAKQKFQQTTMMNVYYILLSSGMFLYMIEFAMQGSPLWCILTYGLTFSWIAFSWYYLRRRQIKKQQKATNELIEKFEGLSKQLTEQE